MGRSSLSARTCSMVPAPASPGREEGLMLRHEGMGGQGNTVGRSKRYHREHVAFGAEFVSAPGKKEIVPIIFALIILVVFTDSASAVRRCFTGSFSKHGAISRPCSRKPLISGASGTWSDFHRDPYGAVLPRFMAVDTKKAVPQSKSVAHGYTGPVLGRLPRTDAMVRRRWVVTRNGL